MTHCKAITKQQGTSILSRLIYTFASLLASVVATAIAIPVAVHDDESGNGDGPKEPDSS